MEIYGDESGHLRSLLDGEEDLFVLAVVAGAPERCMACPKRAVRNVTDIEEAKWSDMTATQRRRLVDCLTESEPHLSFAYVAIERSDLLGLKRHYHLHQDNLEYGWDLCVIGDCYAELVRQVVRSEANPTFTFDRLFSKKMSDRVVDIVQNTSLNLDVNHANSRQVKGIQAADCFAGAVREDRLEGRNWLNEFQEVACATEFALAGVERRLHEQGTGP